MTGVTEDSKAAHCRPPGMVRLTDGLGLVELVRALEHDHGPGGWPAVEMATLSGLADEIERLRAALSEVLEVVSLPREPSWAYRNTITMNKDRIKAACRAGLGA